MELFSQRNQIKSKIMHPKDMPVGLRNRIWNEIQVSIAGTRDDNERNKLILKMWSEFFKKRISELHGQTSYR